MQRRRIGRVHFIELNARVATLGSLGVIFPKYGTTVLSTSLRDAGHDVRVYLEGVSEFDLDEMLDCDMVCMPVFAPALTKVRALAAEIRSRRPELPIVMGGPQVCFFPETVVGHCDWAVRCEGDEVLLDLVGRLEAGEDPRGLPGLSFLADDGAVVNNPEPPPPPIPATIPDLSLIEGFETATRGVLGAWNVVNTIQTSRGCKFRCKFCPTRRLFQGSYRNRDIDAVIADLRERRKINRGFFVVDNDFCCDKKHTRRLLERIIGEDLDMGLIIFERHEIGRDPEMLGLLARAGVRVVIVGVESLLDESLAAYDKRQKREEVLRSIQAIRDHGMHVLSTFVIGGDADTPATAGRLIEFINKSQLSLNLFILHDVEVDPERGLIIPLERRFPTYWQDGGDDAYWDYFSGSFATYFPKRMKPSTLQRAVLEINARVFSHQNILRNALARELQRSLFGVVFGYGMRAINDAVSEVVDGGYLAFLEEIEEGLYDNDEVLIEERLGDLECLPAPPPVPENRPPRAAYAALSLLGSLPGLARFYAPRLGTELAARASRLAGAVRGA